MLPPRFLMASAALLLGLAASGCDREPTKLAEQDDGLTSNDPAVKSAIEDQIMVDPAVTGQSNTNAASAGARPVDGGVPTVRGGGSANDAVADARTRVGGQMLRAPAPGSFEDTCDSNCDRVAGARPATLGGLARQQAGAGCAADVRYGADWAQRLPAAFAIYPRSSLVEAAGVANGSCNVRVVNFQSRAGMQAIMDYYYTMAIRGGYTAEHLLRGTEHYLGGTRGDEAFVIMARSINGGIVDVDLVASGGR
ncbi:MAG: hypothetical protein ABL909_08490 [Sphingopyxis sp.]